MKASPLIAATAIVAVGLLGFASIWYLPRVVLRAMHPAPEVQRIDPKRIKPLVGDAQDLALAGSDLSHEGATKLHESLRRDPGNMNLRTKLLGYAFSNRSEEGVDSALALQLALWTILNAPESATAGLVETHVDPIMQPASYEKGREMWLAHVAAQSKNPRILRHAGDYFLLSDRQQAERLFLDGARLEPKNPDWAERLAHLHSLDTIGASGSEEREAARKACEWHRRVLALRPADWGEKLKYAESALKADLPEEAERTARELLGGKHAREGLVIHHANLVLGRLALDANDVSGAATHLLAAGRTPGAPTLDSFGPGMGLANALLERGEKDVVLRYFELCRKFWREPQLNQWAQDVRAGRMPDFGPRLDD